ncbi:MAG: Ca2+-binding RTX toxin-like protein [Paracoccaceae bacterium]|jgi:Ca2+-binding RTX toxin-like protein
MTTYTFNGFLMHWEDTTGDGKDNKLTLGTTKLKIVAPDREDSFTYAIDPNPVDGGDLPKVYLTGLDPYSNTLGGQDLDGQNTISSVGEIHWGTGNVTQLLSFGNDGTDHLFVVGGVALPTFTSKADIRAFEKIATYFGKVTTGPLQEGAEILLKDLSGVHVTQNDKIVGTSANEVFLGGKGNDKIFGNSGDDRLLGGVGEDVIDGGRDDDLLVGGKNADIFLFRNKYGKDVIRDFTDNSDTLKLDDRLWDGELTKKQVLKKFASIDDGDLVLDFGRHELTLNNFDTIGNLLDDLQII